MEAEQSVVNNPVKMSRIRHQLEAELAAKAEKKKAKKAKKEAKKVFHSNYVQTTFRPTAFLMTKKKLCGAEER